MRIGLFQGIECLKSYTWDNRQALVDYGQRRREGQPISTAGAEGTVNPLVNARLEPGRPNALVSPRDSPRAAGAGRHA